MIANYYGEPPAWDAFSKVNTKLIKPEDYEDEEVLEAERKAKETALVKAKPMSLNGWDPETKTQSILTDEMMQQGAGMGSMDLDVWKAQSMLKSSEGTSIDVSHGAKTIMKKLITAGTGVTNPFPPAQVEVTYVGVVREEDDDPDSLVPASLVFDDKHATVPAIFNLESAVLETENGPGRGDSRFPLLQPPGLLKAIRTMRWGETAKISIMPEEGYGEDGNESLGIGPDAYLEFEITLVRIIPVSYYDNHGIVKRTLRHTNGDLDSNLASREMSRLQAQPNAEVVVRWEGYVVEDAKRGEAFENTAEPFREMAEERFWHGDPATPPWWKKCLSAFRVGETAELTMDAEAAFGEAGSAKYNVPASCAIRVTATLMSTHAVSDLSDGKDRTKRLKILKHVENDIFEPHHRYDCTVDYTAQVIPTPSESLTQDAASTEAQIAAIAPAVTREGAMVTLGTPLHEAAELSASCAGFDVDAALQLMLLKMHKGETCELIVEPPKPPPPAEECAEGADAAGEGGAVGVGASPAGDAEPAPDRRQSLRLVVTLHSWVAVDPVPGTGGEVLKRDVYQPPWVKGEMPAERPPPESVCRVRYICRVAGTGEAYTRGLGYGELVVAVGEMSEEAEGPVAACEAADVASGAIEEFIQGERLVMPCIDAAVLVMKRGERCLISAPAACAFNAPNFPPAQAIDPALRGKDVEILIELVDFDKANDENGMPIPEKVLLHAARKEAANRLYAKNALREAISKWELAEKTLPHDGSLRYDLSRSGRADDVIDAEKKVVEKIQLSCQLNLAATYLKFDEPHPALENAEKALKIDPNSVKGLFRRAQARLRIPPVDIDVVKADLMAAAKLDPKSREIREELEKMKQVRQAQIAEEKGMFGGILRQPQAKSKWVQDTSHFPTKKLEGFASTAFGTRSNPPNLS